MERPNIQLTFLFIIVFSHILFSQIRTRELDLVEIHELQEKFPDSKVINYESESIYEFKINRAKQLVEVTEISSDIFMALHPNSMANAYRYYDNFSELAKNKVSKSNKQISYYRNCGNYEVDGIFFHDNKVCSYMMRFPSAGDNLLLTSTTKYFDARYFCHVSLTSENLIHSMNLSFSIPENINVQLIEMNFEKYDIEKTETYLNDNETRLINYKIKDIPPGIHENIAGPTWVFPHIIVIVKDFTDNGIQHQVFASNQDLYDWYKSLVPNHLSSKKARLKARSIINPDDSQDEKVEKIFNWVKSNIRYIAFEDGIAGYKPEDADIVLENRYGDCKGMANILREMLDEVGVDARLCWVGTSRLAYNDTIPSLVTHNHMICAVNNGNGFDFLDATDRYSNPGESGDHIQNRQVMIENGRSFIIDTITPHDYSENIIRIVYDATLDHGVLYIDGTIDYQGEPRRKIQHLLNEYVGSNDKKLLESFIKNNDSRINVSKLGFGIDSLNPDLYKLDVSLTWKNAVFSHNQKHFVPMDINYGLPFPEIDTSRLYHFDLDMRLSKHYRTIFTIPDSLNIEYLPPSSQNEISNASYSFSWKQIDNTIVYDKILSIKNGIVETSEFVRWNEFITKYNELANQMIILSR